MDARKYGPWGEDAVNRRIEVFQQHAQAGVNAARNDLREAAAEIRRLMAKLAKPEPCLWKAGGGGVWHTGCSRRYPFDHGDAAEHDFAFCPYCGKPIKEEQDRDPLLVLKDHRWRRRSSPKPITGKQEPKP